MLEIISKSSYFRKKFIRWVLDYSSTNFLVVEINTSTNP